MARLGVSKLAAYAEDPQDFLQRRGGVRSRAAVRAGNRAHDRAATSAVGRFFLRVLWLAVLAGVLALLWVFGGLA